MTQMNFEITAGRPTPMGATADVEGVNFAVFSAHATGLEICIFSDDGAEEIARLPLPERSGDIWHGHVRGLGPGALYGLRAHGPYAPDAGHRFNPNKLLIDPYARSLRGDYANDPVVLGYDEEDDKEDLSFDARDSAPFMPKCEIQDPAALKPFTCHPRNAWRDTMIYEAHVKGLTQLHPEVPEAFRGSYEGIASDAMIAHLTRIGVTAIELLPVHGFLNDGFLLDKGLSNYWGYNSVTFFAPEPRYFGPNGVEGFRQMVRKLHAAGIEVILDVVYNHTAEGDQRGPTLSFRGLDNACYYRLQSDYPRFYANDTGCGNTVNVAHPQVIRLVLDSLRYWVEYMGVDGFRFDLATTLGREAHGFDRFGGFFDALRQDPLLAQTKLIAEPWDIGPGGYQLGGFPPEFAEWNDAYRDTVRRFWKGRENSAQELGSRFLGSADRFDRDGRRPQASVNFLAAHDGFTLADVTSYNRKHNEANGEGNRDGHGTNFSNNCGVEGPTDDAAVLELRKRRRRNMLATVLLSQGTPMLLAGDEFANSQQGNNNAYCQDNEISWLNWAEADHDLADFVAALTAFRREHSALRQDIFLHARPREEDGLPDVEWRDLSGDCEPDWEAPDLSELAVVFRGSAEAAAYARTDDAVMVVLNRSQRAAPVSLPVPPDGRIWVVGIDTSAKVQKPRPLVDGNLTAPAQSVLALVLQAKETLA